MPALKRFQHLAILAEIHVVGDFGAVVDVHVVHWGPPVVRSRVPDAVQRSSRCTAEPGPVSVAEVGPGSASPVTCVPRSARDTDLNSRHVELRLLAGAVAAQRAVFADRV